MKTLRLISLAVRYHWDSQKSNPANLFAAVFGMILNNGLAVWGLWAMLFDGKPDGKQLTVYFLALNGMITIAWGSVCFFLGGLHSLSTHVEDGSLDPMLATPRNPILLVAISNSLTAALGDVIQGSLTIVILFFIASWTEALRCVLFSFIGIFAVMGLFIFTGCIPFWMKRGSSLSILMREMCLALSFYPSSKIFNGMSRTLVYLTPALVVGILPIDAVETGTWSSSFIATSASIAFFFATVQLFGFSLKRYQTSNYVMAR